MTDWQAVLVGFLVGVVASVFAFALPGVGHVAAGLVGGFAAGFLAASFGDPALADEPFPADPDAYRTPLVVANACGAIAAETVTARAALSWDRLRRVVDADVSTVRLE